MQPYNSNAENWEGCVSHHWDRLKKLLILITTIIMFDWQYYTSNRTKRPTSPSCLKFSIFWIFNLYIFYPV